MRSLRLITDQNPLNIILKKANKNDDNDVDCFQHSECDFMFESHERKRLVTVNFFQDNNYLLLSSQSYFLLFSFFLKL